MRNLLALLCLSTVIAQAETVQLRRTGNPTVITFEYITQDELTVMVKLADKDNVLTYRWEDLDQDWIKKNNPKLWAERELLLTPVEVSDKKMGKKEEELDPFAVVIVPTDVKSLLKTLNAALYDGLKGLPIEKNIVAACKEVDLEETLFWKGYEELKRASASDPSKIVEAPVVEKEREVKAKPTVKTKNSAAVAVATRSLANIEKETNAKKDLTDDLKPFTGFGYLKQASEGNAKMKIAWMILRRAPDDRKIIVACLRKHEAMASELADKTESKSIKSDALVVKKIISNVAEDIEKISRETLTMEVKFQNDCQALISRMSR